MPLDFLSTFCEKSGNHELKVYWSLPEFTKSYLFGFFLLIIPFYSVAQLEISIGINLSPIHDFSTEFVFIDAFKQSRTWISHNADGTGPRDTGSDIPLDEFGYPLAIPYGDGLSPPQTVRALVLWDLADHFPSGDYRLIVVCERTQPSTLLPIKANLTGRHACLTRLFDLIWLL
jgi:hypothetical protein